MSYFVTWSTDGEVISEEEFDDIFTAESYIFRNRHKFEKQGATGARVWNGCATYFQIDWKPKPGNTAH
jgi:hypothetical protein